MVVVPVVTGAGTQRYFLHQGPVVVQPQVDAVVLAEGVLLLRGIDPVGDASGLRVLLVKIPFVVVGVVIDTGDQLQYFLRILTLCMYT